MRLTWVISIAAVVGGLGLSTTAQSAGSQSALALFDSNVEIGGQFEPGTIALEVDPSLKLAAVKRLAQKQGCEWDHQWGKHPYHTVNCSPEKSMRSLITGFSAMSGVRWVEAGFYDEEETTPNDLFEELQWYHSNVGQPIDMVTTQIASNSMNASGKTFLSKGACVAMSTNPQYLWGEVSQRPRPKTRRAIRRAMSFDSGEATNR